MCGIGGIIDYRRTRETISPKILKRMSDVIIHRGPDAEGQLISRDGNCGMTFRRLSIIDLTTAGNQPMRSLNNNSIIVFNGEIYIRRGGGGGGIGVITSPP